MDKVLGGGFYTNEVVEVYGEAAQGKTQLAFQTSAFTCLKHSFNVVYVDTSNSFSAERVTDIFHHYKSNEKVSWFMKSFSH